jgi:hypothetical protein
MVTYDVVSFHFRQTSQDVHKGDILSGWRDNGAAVPDSSHGRCGNYSGPEVLAPRNSYKSGLRAERYFGIS